MPAAPAAPPPAAPAAPAPAAAPKIQIGAPTSVTPAMQRSFDRMQKMATPEPAGDTPAPAVTPTPDAKAPEPAKTPDPVKEPVKEPEGKVDPEVKEPTESVEGKDGDGKSAPSWKLVQTYKAEAKALKKELAELRGNSGNLPQLQDQLKSASERAESAEKRAKELSDHMRFLDYQRSDEFVKNHQQPWERACTKAAKDLADLNLTDSSGNARKATINDLMTLCSMGLGQAREQADAWFGSSAGDVMNHRSKLNDLMESQQLALDEAKKNGEGRFKQQSEATEKLKAETAGLWQKFDQEAVEKYDFLKPKDGDDEHNEKLEKATKFVSTAMSRNPMDPRLSPEDRATGSEK